MSKFLKLTILERQEGMPGFVEMKQVQVNINPDQVTLYNPGEEKPNLTFVRLSCGITVCANISADKFAELLEGVKK